MMMGERIVFQLPGEKRSRDGPTDRCELGRGWSSSHRPIADAPHDSSTASLETVSGTHFQL